MKRWLTNFSKEAYYVLLSTRRMALPQGAVPGGESIIAVMRVDSRKLVHARITKPCRIVYCRPAGIPVPQTMA